jgi:hypothetical protein
MRYSIGNTPLVGMLSMSPKPGVRLWAKLKGRNPDGLDEGPHRQGR